MYGATETERGFVFRCVRSCTASVVQGHLEFEYGLKASYRLETEAEATAQGRSLQWYIFEPVPVDPTDWLNSW